MMQLTVSCDSTGICEFKLSSAKMMFFSICWASSLVGVRMSPKIFLGKCSNPKFSFRYCSSEMMGAAKARVLPEPVCAAMRKS